MKNEETYNGKRLSILPPEKLKERSQYLEECLKELTSEIRDKKINNILK